MALLCPHDHDNLDHGATMIMINQTPHWIEPEYLDPTRTPTRNTAHHIPRTLTEERVTPAADHVLDRDP